MTFPRLVALTVVIVALGGSTMTLPAAAQDASAAQSAAQAGWTLERHQELARHLAAHVGVARAWTPPRTAWGHPDLEGAWTSDSARGIPRERPASAGARLFLTDQELGERQARDAQTLENARNASGAQTGGRDGAWRGRTTFPMTSQIVDPPNGRTPAVTAEAQKRRASRDRGSFGEGPFNTFADFTLYDRCITRGIVGSVLPVPYGNGNRILQTPDSVVISYEMIHDTRIIPLDGRAHLTEGIRQYLGDSRARWHGDTLVIETTNFTDETSIGANGNGLRHSAAMRMTERLTRVADDVLLYDVTIDDPATYARPWTIALPLVSPAGFQPLPYECHEGNGAIKYILSAERAEDRSIEEDLRKGLVRPRRPIQGDINTLPEN
jgi:hypothetical protein